MIVYIKFRNFKLDKLEYIHDRIYCLCSGSAADTRILCKHVRNNIDVHSLELDKLP